MKIRNLDWINSPSNILQAFKYIEKIKIEINSKLKTLFCCGFFFRLHKLTSEAVAEGAL